MTRAEVSLKEGPEEFVLLTADSEGHDDEEDHVDDDLDDPERNQYAF